MSIFNSLGSNYDFRSALQTLFQRKDFSAKLTTLLEKEYNGKALLVYKGREAILLSLQLLQMPKGTQVAINGFTCFAVYNAVTNAGYSPVLLDIEKTLLHFSAEILEKAMKQFPSLKVVIIQNTLGIACDIEKIAAVCTKHNLILIEDLAHSVGLYYANRKEAGTIGDFVTLSFSQDKMIDTVSGGALVIRNKTYHTLPHVPFKKVPRSQQLKDRWYPFLTYCIRKSYDLHIGKLLHSFLRQLSVLSQPVGNPTDTIHALPLWYCKPIYQGFQNLAQNINHRKTVAGVYEQIDKKSIGKREIKSIFLRFPFFVDNRSSLISYLKKHHVYIADIWYDSPISPKQYMQYTNYHGECPNAENIAKTIISLPTHRNVNARDARMITERITTWLQSA